MLLAAHVAVGAAALITGPLAYASRRRRPAAIRSYFAAVLCVAATALALVAAQPAALWWLAPLALLTAVLAELGRRASRGKAVGARRLAAHGWGGSYIALVTALLVVSVSMAPAIWLLPSVAGVALIELHLRLTSRRMMSRR